jgi:3-hydroxybutyryl-CoA dehydrogenase
MSLTVAIIGAGPLGRWLALRAARAGFRVLLEDVMPNNLEHAQEEIRRQLGRQIEAEPQPEIAFVSTIEDAVRQADLVIDCVPDELESKLEIFWLLDRMAPPRAVLATPTLRQSIVDLAACTYRPAQCIAVAVEASSLTAGASREILLRTTPQTAPAATALGEDFWRKLDFLPTTVVETAPPAA